MRYIVTRKALTFRTSGRNIPTGLVDIGYVFNLIDVRNGRFAFEMIVKNRPVTRWISDNAAVKMDDVIPHPQEIDPALHRLRFHSQVPSGFQNRKSFGIVPLYGSASKKKPHQVILSKKLSELYRQLQSQEYYDANIHNYPCDNPQIQNAAGQPVDREKSFHWLFEHDDNKFYGAHYSGQAEYRIPAQGVFGGNLVRPLATSRGFTQIAGVTGLAVPKIDELYNRPDLVHFCWCVGRGGETINPPCKSAFVLVLNPVGLRGVTNALDKQTKIWIQNKWI